MQARFPTGHDHNKWAAADISQLPNDLKRVLSVQFREFIHHIEDSELGSEIESNPRVINFLERCYRDAA